MKTTNKLEKILIAILVGFFIFLFGISSLTHATEEEGASLNDLVVKILQKQKVNKVSDLDCSKISEKDLEELGEAVMSKMHPDKRVHEFMDRMMGGEGSESLRNAHIMMAKRFLGCVDSFSWMGMMSPLMMMGDLTFDKNFYGGERGWGKMMGYGMGGGFGLYSLFGLITWIALLLFLILGAIYFYQQIKGKK